MNKILPDVECRNTAGFFMDPFTGLPLGPETERVQGYGILTANWNPETKTGFREPVKGYLADGSAVPLSHTCYTQDEKKGYTEYRKPGSGSSTVTRTPGQPAQLQIGPQEPKQPNTPYMLKQIEMLEKLIQANLPDLVEDMVKTMAPNWAEKLGEYEAVLLQVEHPDAESLANKMAIGFFRLEIQAAKDLWVKYAQDMEQFKLKKAEFDEKKAALKAQVEAQAQAQTTAE